MKRLKGRTFFIICAFAALATLTAANARAFAPYKGYTYDPNGHSVTSLNGYEPVRWIAGRDMGVSDLKNPKDFFVSNRLGRIYVLDSGNGRIVILNDRFEPEKIVARFEYEGRETALNDPSSLFVTDAGEIYVADTANRRVLITDDTGRIRKIIGKPASDMYPENVAFEPLKVLADPSGNIYVLIKGLYQGALVLTPEGEFNRFFAGAKVTPTLEVLMSRFWRLFMTKEQKAALPDYVPTEFTGFDIDREGFLYTVTQEHNTLKTLKKFNALGSDVIQTNDAFGDLESHYDREEIVTRFVDVNAADNGFADALDLTRGRVFRYDRDFNLLFVFGGPGGEQLGTFKSPAAVDDLGDDILVLDSDLACITVFSPTEFGRKVIRAIDLYNAGEYLAAVEPWKEIVAQNENYALAHKGIGDGLFMLGRYKEAMVHYKAANDKTSYLRAFREYRNIVVRRYFPLFSVAAMAVFGIVVGGKKLLAARGKRR